MRILQEVNSQRLFAIQIGQGGNSSLTFIPSGFFPFKNFVKIKMRKNQTSRDYPLLVIAPQLIR